MVVVALNKEKKVIRRYKKVNDETWEDGRRIRKYHGELNGIGSFDDISDRTFSEETRDLGWIPL